MTDKPRRDTPRASPTAPADGLGFDLDRALKKDHENASDFQPPRSRKHGLWAVARGCFQRALKLYGAHIALTLAALVIFACAWMTGKAALHAVQLATINAVFTPSSEAVAARLNTGSPASAPTTGEIRADVTANA